MPDNLITQYGRALYGARWRTEMSRDLGVNERTVRRWEAGELNPRPGVFEDLKRLAAERVKDLRAVMAEASSQ
jgi:ribosome-binding protein aMBF1 (putative translation factor)